MTTETEDQEQWPTDEQIIQAAHDREQARDGQIARLREWADLLENNPELDVDSSFSSYVPDTPYLPDQWSYYETHTDMITEFRKAWVKSNLRVFSRLGFTIEKISNDYEFGFTARNPETQARARVAVNNAGICQIVETDETEDVAIVEVPENVQAVYTRYERKPITKKECPPILSAADIETLLS